MEKGTQIDIIERQFGHIVIKWQIGNFCLETSREDFLISTPEFCIDGRHATKWRLALNPKVRKDEEYAFHLTFERAGSDETPEMISVDLKMWMLDCDGNECESVMHKSEFKKIKRLELPLWSISYIRERLKAELYKTGTLTIWCHIIINFEDCVENIEGPSDIGWKTLSENLLELYRTSDDHDVVLRIDDNNISAHKAILYSRSTVLADMITENKVDDISFLDYKTMQDILAYFYSGDFNYIAKSPSILMFESAAYLGLSDIMQYYNPLKLEIHSFIDVREHVFSWAIKNFRELQGDCITSPVLASDYMDGSFVISLYIGHNKSEHVSVFVDIVEGTIPKYSCLGISITDEGTDLHAEKMQLPSESNERFGFEKFTTKEYFKTILNKISGDTLNIALKIELHNDTVSSTEKYALNSSSLSKKKCNGSLSSYLTFILQHSLFTDIVVEVDGTSIKANKCILSARSPVFRTMIQEVKDNRIVILNMKSNILRPVINYIYSGVYENSNPDDIFEVYKAAVHFGLPLLRQKCRKLLQDNLNAQIVIDVLIFSDEQKDLELKNFVVDFIHQNKICVSGNNYEKTLTGDKPSLFTEVVKSLMLNKCNDAINDLNGN